MVHGDDQWAGVQELGAAVLLEGVRLVSHLLGTAELPGPCGPRAPHHVGADNPILGVG